MVTEQNNLEVEEAPVEENEVLEAATRPAGRVGLLNRVRGRQRLPSQRQPSQRVDRSRPRIQFSNPLLRLRNRGRSRSTTPAASVDEATAPSEVVTEHSEAAIEEAASSSTTEAPEAESKRPSRRLSLLDRIRGRRRKLTGN